MLLRGFWRGSWKGKQMSNIIDAIINLVNNPVLNLRKAYSDKNRANNMGDALEEYVKDLFAGSFECKTQNNRNIMISDTFSYTGNSSNPPDAMLKNGDAIEVKKIESNNSALALNSSYPKHKLYSDSNMISNACRTAEDWKEKDIIYVVGISQKNKLRHLCMVYGEDYCASNETYERIKNTIKDGVERIPNIELAETDELGKLKKVDPLGITYLRIRGMWGIENPFKVFEYVFTRDFNKNFNFMAIINLKKYSSLNNSSKLEELANINNKLKIQNIKIKNPDNPAKLNDAKLITYVI